MFTEREIHAKFDNQIISGAVQQMTVQGNM